MKNNIQAFLLTTIQDSLRELKLDNLLKEDLSLDYLKDSRFGDFSTNIALRLSKLMQKPPLDICAPLLVNIKKYLEKNPLKDYVLDVKVEGVGFINFYLNNNYFYLQLKNIITKGKAYLRLNVGKKISLLIEFVSANPTGPLSVAHARQAIVGDVLGNILDFLEFKVKKEYYINDEGNQINILAKSIELRAKELSGEVVEFSPNYYQGDYIYDIAKEISATKSATRHGGYAKNYGEKSFSDYGVKYILKIIKEELKDFGVKFDYWYSQKALRKSSKIKKTLDFLNKKGFLYRQDGALWFKSKHFGDDKDRVVVKSDGSYTYLAPDIAYHQEKYRRGFSLLINIWGPDHHGYIGRLKAAVEALGKSPDSLSIIIVQLASIFRNGKPQEMSTRKGQYITLREVLDEVGPDAARFFFLMRRTSSHLDFDLDIAKKHTPQNPVYYVQYAYARICSILRHNTINKKSKNLYLSLLIEKEEIDLIKKILQFYHILNVCFKTQDPYMLTVYLQELAESFHKFYDNYRVLGQDKKLTLARLGLIKAVQIVIDTGLELLGVSRPKEM